MQSVPGKSAYGELSFEDIRARFATLRQAPVGGGRAPHKPLLILLMLGRYQGGKCGPATFQEIRESLAGLLRDFGPPSVGTPDVSNPFWRLQNDEGRIWEVRDSYGSTIAETVAPPTIGTLVERDARGNFPADLSRAFQVHPEYISRLATHILRAHFPPSLHEDICNEVEIHYVPDSASEETEQDNSTPRDPGFRTRIIRAYEHRCVISGWDLRIGNSPAGGMSRVDLQLSRTVSL
jgi:putative restriction endonuclease